MKITLTFYLKTRLLYHYLTMSRFLLYVLFLVVLVPSLYSWNLIGSFADFDIVKTDSSINMAIVTKVVKASSLIECFSREHPIDSSSSTIRSIYFDKNAGMCYFNSEYDTNISGHVETGAIFYGESRKSYRKELSSSGERVAVNEKSYSSCTDVYKDGFRHAAVYRMSDVIPDAACSADGWTIFQRRQDGSVDFYRGWADYVDGFGNKSGEFWLGLENLHRMTMGDTCELYIYLKAEADNPVLREGYARYLHFRVDDAASNYTLHVSGFSGNVRDSFGSHNGYQFSTFDMDHDILHGNCASKFNGAWWYHRCHSSNLNGLYLNGHHSSYANGINWSKTWTQFYSLIEVEMRIRCG